MIAFGDPTSACRMCGTSYKLVVRDDSRLAANGGRTYRCFVGLFGLHEGQHDLKWITGVK
jgi:hypothetical protein